MADNKTTYLINVKQKGAKKSEKSLKSLAKTVAKVGAAYLGGRALLAGVTMTTAAFGEQEKVEKKLEQALGKTSTALLKQASALQKVSLSGDEAIIAQQAFLASIGMTEQQIKDILPVALDLAAATGLTLESAVRNTAKTFSGLAGELGELVPQVRELTPEAMKAGKAVEVMGELFAGAASTEAETFSGKITRIVEVAGDMAEEFGSVLAPAMDAIMLKFLSFNDALTEEEETQENLIQLQKDLNFVQQNIASNKIAGFEVTQDLLDKEEELQQKILAITPTKMEAEKEYHDNFMKNVAEEIQIKDIQTEKDIKREKRRQTQAEITENMTILSNSNLMGSFASLGAAIDEDSKIAKALTIAQATADTYAGANKAFAQGGVLGWATGAAIIAGGLANVVNINNAYKEQKAQYGFAVTVTEPTTFTVGEGGAAEYVSVQPMEGVNNAGGQGINVYISGNVMSQDFVESELSERIQEAVRKGVSFA